MSGTSRRNFVLGASALATTAACGNGIGSAGQQRLDQRVDAAKTFMFDNIPGSEDLHWKASGSLIMPLVTEAGFGLGASYGRGALLVNDVPVDYYSALQGTFGFQIGAQQYAHALFFMTEESLAGFRQSRGWAAGADVKYALKAEGASLGIDTNTVTEPIIAIIFGQAGLIVGATLEGTKYSRIIP